MTRAAYVITENAINIRFGSTRRLVPSDTYMYDVLSDQLKGNSLDLEHIPTFGEYARKSDTFKNKYGINERVKQMEDKGLPTKPFLSLLDKISEQLLAKDPTLLLKAGTNNLPLTYSGNIIGYQRSSFLPTDTRSAVDWVTTFEPGYVSNGRQAVSTFDYIKNRCADTGNVYQVMICPEDIIDIDNNGFVVSKTRQLSKLGRTVTEAEKPQSEMLYINKDGETTVLSIGDKASEILEMLYEFDPFS